VTLEEVLWSTRVEDFVKTTQMASNFITVQRGGNSAECFLEVAAQAVGCRGGFILFPEGCEGR
jgi:predicted hotdog family 3-hydroxylacyl-ACP dehydratase